MSASVTGNGLPPYPSRKPENLSEVRMIVTSLKDMGRESLLISDVHLPLCDTIVKSFFFKFRQRSYTFTRIDKTIEKDFMEGIW